MHLPASSILPASANAFGRGCSCELVNACLDSISHISGIGCIHGTFAYTEVT